MSMRKKGKKLQYLMIIFFFGFSLAAAQESFEDDEVYKTALEKGKLVAEYWTKNSGKNPSTTDYYADICSYYGACIFGDTTGDSSIYEYINSQYNRTTPIITTDIDKNSCGILPLHLYLHNGNTQQLKLGTDAADANIQQDGHFRNAVDDTYMTGSLLVQAYRATGDDKYLDFCADYIVRYINSLQQSNGLYHHGAGGSQQYWGRGNGWASAGSAELLQVIPKDHEQYDEVVAGFKNHMKGLIDVQLESGMWPQLLGSDDPRNWEETSGTSMFLYGIFTGMELGLLDTATYLQPARKGWLALIEYLSNDGKLNNIAEGFWPSTGTADEYLNAPEGAPGNSHGTAGILWAATAIVRYFKADTQTVSIQKHARPSYLSAQSVTPLQQGALFDLRGRKIPAAHYRFNDMVLPTGIIIHSNNTSIRKMLMIE